MTISSPRFARSLTRPALAATAAALAASACATDDLPETQLGNTSDLLVEAVAPAPERTPVLTADGIDPFLLGDWVGRAEDLFSNSNPDGSRPAYTFPSGSQEIYLHLDLPRFGDGDSHLRFGQREAPLPEPGVAYGDVRYYIADVLRIVGAPSYPPVEGVAYPLWREALLIDDDDHPALGFAFPPEAAFDQWCPLQPPQPLGDGSFNCSGTVGLGSGDLDGGAPCQGTLPDGSEQDIDCDFAKLCQLACTCDEASCQAEYNEPLRGFWIAREGDQLIGHLTGAVFEHGLRRPLPIGTIRFDRAEP